MDLKGNHMNSNKMELSQEINDKVNHRTHHTRFFEKLYGNLESSTEKTDVVELSHSNDNSTNSTKGVRRPDVLNSPSDSSGSSSEIYSNDVSTTRCDKYL